MFVSLRMLYEQTGYAYIKVYVAGDATNSLMIEFDYEYVSKLNPGGSRKKDSC